MIVKLNLITTVLFGGILVGCYQTWALSFLKSRDQASKLLAVSAFVITLILAQYFLVISGGYAYFPHLLGTTQVLMAALGPTLYLFTRYSIAGKHFLWTDLTHFIPLLLLCWMYLPVFMQDGSTKVQVIESQWHGAIYFSWYYFIFLVLFAVQVITYLVLIRKTLGKSYQALLQEGSNTLMVRLGWLQILMKIFILFVLSFLAIYSFRSLQFAYTTITESVIMLGFAAFIYSVGHYTLRKELVFEQIGTTAPPPDAIEDTTESAAKYKSSALTPDIAAQYMGRLLNHMESKRPYLNPDLRLSDLAEELNIPKHQLSQVINQKLELNFFDFVNQYRVELAKQQLTDDRLAHVTIQGIAMESGFSNKASFNRIFKKFTDLTPSAYIKQHKMREMSNTL